MPLIQHSGGRGRQISEFKASLVYIASSKLAWTTGTPCLKKDPPPKKKILWKEGGKALSYSLCPTALTLDSTFLVSRLIFFTFIFDFQVSSPHLLWPPTSGGAVSSDWHTLKTFPESCSTLMWAEGKGGNGSHSILWLFARALRSWAKYLESCGVGAH